jgi:hypothetical protein
MTAICAEVATDGVTDVFVGENGPLAKATANCADVRARSEVNAMPKRRA